MANEAEIRGKVGAAAWRQANWQLRKESGKAWAELSMGYGHFHKTLNITLRSEDVT